VPTSPGIARWPTRADAITPCWRWPPDRLRLRAHRAHPSRHAPGPWPCRRGHDRRPQDAIGCKGVAWPVDGRPKQPFARHPLAAAIAGSPELSSGPLTLRLGGMDIRRPPSEHSWARWSRADRLLPAMPLASGNAAVLVGRRDLRRGDQRAGAVSPAGRRHGPGSGLLPSCRARSRSQTGSAPRRTSGCHPSCRWRSRARRRSGARHPRQGPRRGCSSRRCRSH
jgi:hypothetical protein